MSVAIAEARPPYVEFVEVPVEDRDQSIAAGHTVYKVEHFAHITPIGSKERMERKVDDWFTHLQSEVAAERFPASWLAQYRSAYADWKSGHETPENGTPLAMWPAINPGQLRTLRDLKFRTVEDLAQANEEAIRRMGMGARELKQKAENWLQVASNQGKVVEKVTAMEVTNKQLLETNERLQKQVAQLKSEVEALRSAN